MNGSAVTPPNASRNISDEVRNVVQRLAICAQHTSGNEDSFSKHCITLSRLLDTAITNKVPAIDSELPAIFKLVCQRKNECSLQAAIMVLMVTAKSACKAQWFSKQESQEILTLADEMMGFFCITEGFSCEQADVIPTVSKIIPRYYPQLKLGGILASVAIKPGFQACAVDFDIPRRVHLSSMERIRLLVVSKDKIDTSSCIINPPEVNILLNGVGVQGKIVGYMYQGPQLPPVVNPMLRYGTNLLQAIGTFDAHYVLLIAYMSSIQLSDLPSPHDYHQPPAAVIDSEAEIVEGPSKISLNCPISLKRIRQPARGHLCKHLQCFDLNNYIEINFKRPSWKCPYCNQPVCYPDIRVDQKVAKILKEVSESATSVLIHSNGSWEEATSVSTNHNDRSHTNVSEAEQTTNLEIDPSNVYDLTQDYDDILTLDVDALKDQKPAIQPPAIQPPAIQAPAIQAPAIQAPAIQPQSIQNPVNNQVPSIPFSMVNPGPVNSHSVPPTANREQQSLVWTNQRAGSPTLVCPPSSYSAFMQQLQHGQINGGYAMPGNSASASTHVYLDRMESLRQWHMSQQRLSDQNFYNSIQGNRGPVQVSNNGFRPTTPIPGNHANLMHNMNYAPPHLRGTLPTMAQNQMMSPAGVSVSSGYIPQRVIRPENLLNEQPAGRMRGSLAGRACDLYVIRPTQQTMTHPDHNNMLSPRVQALLANRNLNSTQPNLNSTSVPHRTNQFS